MTNKFNPVDIAELVPVLTKNLRIDWYGYELELLNGSSGLTRSNPQRVGHLVGQPNPTHL